LLQLPHFNAIKFHLLLFIEESKKSKITKKNIIFFGKNQNSDSLLYRKIFFRFSGKIRNTLKVKEKIQHVISLVITTNNRLNTQDYKAYYEKKFLIRR